MLPLREAERVFRFGDFELRERPMRLWRRGRRVELRHQCLDLLLLLVERSGSAVGRDEIRHHLWGDGQRVDHDAAINTTVSNLRRALDEDGRRPRYIETLPKRGYCFIATVEMVEPRAAKRGASRLRHWMKLLSAL